MNPTVKILVLVGLLAALAGACTWFGWFLHRYFHGYPNPPATRRTIERAARANRADLSAVRQAAREPLPELLVPMPLDHFDHGGTEP